MEFRRRRLLPLEDNTTVNVTVRELRKIENVILDLREKNEKLSEGVPAVSDLEKLSAGFPSEDALAIIQWAVGNLPPEMHRGWPYRELKNVGAYLRGNGKGDTVSLGITFEEFSKEAGEIEDFRAHREKVAAEVLSEQDE